MLTSHDFAQQCFVIIWIIRLVTSYFFKGVVQWPVWLQGPSGQWCHKSTQAETREEEERAGLQGQDHFL